MNNIISLKISFYAVKSLILGAEKQDVFIAPVFFNCKINTFFWGCGHCYRKNNGKISPIKNV